MKERGNGSGSAYADRLKRHLADYKVLRLGIADPGTFEHRGRQVQHDHILPLEQQDLNLLERARRFLSEYEKQRTLTRHQFFHHLNSSQAFAFNLFFPYFCCGSYCARSLLRAFGQNSELAGWEPEAVPDEAEGSNIDIRWCTSDGVTTFCEVKLSETGIGTTLNDSRHRCKLENIYAPVLAPYFNHAQLEPSVFFRSYQYYRNVWHMVRTPEARLVFLLPKQNIVLWRQLQDLLRVTSNEIAGRISMVAIEDVLASLIADRRAPDDLRQYAATLGEKYLIRSADITHDPGASA